MAAHPTPSHSDMISEVLSQSLGLAFDSIKDKLSTNVHENGEQYLQQAVEKIKESTSGIVDWAKANPMKTALALAALAAASAFLVRTVNSSITSSSGEDDEKTAAKGSSAKGSSSAKAKKKSA